ncbi:hypothetical protein [Salinibacterium sp. SWN1162]|uniref:hypothetical protein n=1 Tax=Salinibacterium sp. SWN1162 TaxID=2792053 RepID=UPI0018CE1505|nr:hypothetical protein [Salinibacterium sp. SWN1162]MBH0008867.1 hypothetical protein [Salinibacterium sp. SWN1162]
MVNARARGASQRRIPKELRFFNKFVTFVSILAVVVGIGSVARALYVSLLWPTKRIAECAGDFGCVAETIARDGVPVWTGALWFLLISVIIVGGIVAPPPADAVTPAQRNESLRTVGDQRIALVVGWILVASSFGFFVLLTGVPLAANAVALATWSDGEIERCKVDSACVVSALSQNSLPVWFAVAWALIVAIAMVICWKPARWWVPVPGRGRVSLIRGFTSPWWVRRHAMAMTVISV